MSSPTTPAPPSAPQHLDTMDVSASLEARPDEHGCETAAPGAGEGMGVVGVEVGDEVALCGTFFLAFLKEGASGYVIDERFLRTHLVVGFEIKRGQEREYLLASPLEPRTGKRLRATARMLKPVGSSGDRYALRRLAEAEYYHHWVRQAAGPGGRCTSHRNQPLEAGEPAKSLCPGAGAPCVHDPGMEDDHEVVAAPAPQGEIDRGTPGETGARRSVMPSEGPVGDRGSVPRPDSPERRAPLDAGYPVASREQRVREGIASLCSILGHKRVARACAMSPRGLQLWLNSSGVGQLSPGRLQLLERVWRRGPCAGVQTPKQQELL